MGFPGSPGSPAGPRQTPAWCDVPGQPAPRGTTVTSLNKKPLSWVSDAQSRAKSGQPPPLGRPLHWRVLSRSEGHGARPFWLGVPGPGDVRRDPQSRRHERSDVSLSCQGKRGGCRSTPFRGFDGYLEGVTALSFSN